MWQDYVFTAAQIVFCLSLIPTILAKEKPPLATSLTIGTAVLVSAATFGTLHLWFSCTTQSVVGLEWLFIAYQRITSKDSSPAPTN